jgi:hypothetical protein
MGYAEFEAKYKQVYETVLDGRRDRDLTAKIARQSAWQHVSLPTLNIRISCGTVGR